MGHSRHAAYFTWLVLSLVRQNQWEEVGTIAYGNGDPCGVLKVAEEWEEAYPRRLRIFYLDGGDFCGCHGRGRGGGRSSFGRFIWGGAESVYRSCRR